MEQKYKTIVSDGYEVDSIVKNISLIDPNKKFVEGKTLIFFDELQEFPDIATALKAFQMDGRYEMFSMDFEEFLWAKGYDNSAIEDILQHMKSMKPFSETEFMVYKKLFLDYCVLGGHAGGCETIYRNRHLFRHPGDSKSDPYGL